VTQHKQVSDDTAHTIDEEVRKIIDSNYQRADRILKENLEKLHVMAKALMKYETIDATQVKAIMDGNEPGPPADWDDSSEPSPPGDGSATAESDAAAGNIGGPAQEH